MRRDFLIGMGLLASVAAGAGSAVAADIPVRPAAAPAMVAPTFVPDWVGFYVGIHGGGGGAHVTHDPAFVDPFDDPLGLSSFSRPNTSPSGGVFGFQFGHNWQWGPAVGGLEIDFSGADIKDTTTFFHPLFAGILGFNRDFKIDKLASARGRLGYLIFPNWLLYGTAGIGWGHSRMNETAFVVGAPTTTAFQRSEINEFGWVVGAGVEFKFWNNWLLRGEWLHYDFGRTNQFELGTFVGVDTFNSTPVTVRTTVDVGRAALSYKF